MSSFVIPDVSAEHIMGVAKFASVRGTATSGGTFSRQLVCTALGLSPELARRAILACVQLRLVSPTGTAEFRFAGRGDIRLAKKDNLPLFFREALQDYPPFLLALALLSQGYELREAGALVKGALEIDSGVEIIVKAFRGWGSYASVLEQVNGRWVPTFEPLGILDFTVLSRLQEALEDDVKAKMFVLDELGTDLASELFRKGISVTDLADALVRFQTDPNDVGNPVGNLVECYVSSLQPSSPLTAGPPQASTGAPLSNIIPIAESLRKQRIILKTHRNLLYGVAGFRNAPSHGPDDDTGRPWDIGAHAALVTVLLTLVTMRSIHRWVSSEKQEL